MAGEGLASATKHIRRSGLKRKEVGSLIQGPAARTPICPECASNRVWKDGLRKKGNGSVQRWLCRSCGFRFTGSSSHSKVKGDVFRKAGETFNSGSDLLDGRIVDADFPLKEGRDDFPLPAGEDVGSHKVTVLGKGLNTFPSCNSKCRVCETEAEGSKNLAEVESQKEVGQREATTSTSADVKGKIVEFAWWMQKQGYRPETIKLRSRWVKRLVALGTDLFNPESVKETLARQTNWREGTKNIAVVTYSSFLEMLGKTWIPPKYKQPESLPFIPLESEIDALIHGCGKKMGCFLQGLKDTGADPGELVRLEWTDINAEAKSVTIKHPVKGHNSRVIPVSDAFLRRLGSMTKKGSRVFCTLIGLNSSFLDQRRNATRKLGNLRLLKITFRTLRHWKGTMEYHKTKDILHVKRILGHKQIQSTMIYINLEAALFSAESEEFTVRVTETLKEACSLMEIGFDYVGKIHGVEVFRKRK
jgi:integrase/ribosomal protein L37AE/L43A